MTENSSTEFFLNEARRIVREAETENITLRVMGGVGIRLHCSNFEDLFSRIRRLEGREFGDIDLISLREDAKRLRSFFEQRAYWQKTSGAGMIVQGFGRQTFEGERLSVDVFIDRLVMCHTIDLRDRIRLDNPTIPLADLLLAKLQIVEINMKDIKDVVMLLREHTIGESSNESVDSRYIAKVLSSDWGFYHTAMINLEKIRKTFLPGIVELDDSDRADVKAKLTRLIATLETAPKSMKWALRSKVGTKSKWYSDVFEPG